jgi:hypothetical protein
MSSQFAVKEADQRKRATQSLMRSQGMTDGEDYRDLLTRLSTALAMTEAAFLEARRRRTDGTLIKEGSGH